MKVSAASSGPSMSTVSQGGPSSASISPVAAPQSVHAGACWGGDTRAAAAVHFTCLDRAVKLRNMAQLYANGTCDVCGKC